MTVSEGRAALPPAQSTTEKRRTDMSLIELANPSRFVALINSALPWLSAATVVAFAVGVSQVFLAPDDYQQGATVKIMFVHVPAAWLGIFGWVLMSAAALGTLVWRHPLADVAAKAAAPIGAAFTLMCLVTGSLWGRPMWGTYWVWDARLTSVLVLFLMYLGVIALWRTMEDPAQAARAAAVLRATKIPPAILVPLIVMAVAFTLLFATLHVAAMRNEIMRRRVRTLMMLQAGPPPGARTRTSLPV